jgi:hypothetical protein
VKRTPIIRKTPLVARKQFAAMTAVRQALTVAGTTGKGRAVAIKPKLRQGRSTGKATKAQAARWNDMRARGCVACHVNAVDHGLARASYAQGLEIHHLLSGGRRRGHDDTVCLCRYHHQGDILPYPEAGYGEHAKRFGPSLGREPRRFREFYGSDDELLAYQNLMLDGAEVFGQGGEA